MNIDKNKLQRINVVGSSGSGKSTFSKNLSMALGLSHIEMDALFWLPNWTQPSNEVFFGKLKRSLDQEHWILDGNYDRSREVKWQNVQTVILLDLPFARTLYQSILRAIRRIWSRKEIWPNTGNKETFYQTFFSRESILLWMIQNRNVYLKRFEQARTDPTYSHIQFIRLSSNQEMNQFIKQIK
jgi:adenylate kinase family enzyme